MGFPQAGIRTDGKVGSQETKKIFSLDHILKYGEFLLLCNGEEYITKALEYFLLISQSLSLSLKLL